MNKNIYASVLIGSNAKMENQSTKISSPPTTRKTFHLNLKRNGKPTKFLKEDEELTEANEPLSGVEMQEADDLSYLLAQIDYGMQIHTNIYLYTKG